MAICTAIDWEILRVSFKTRLHFTQDTASPHLSGRVCGGDVYARSSVRGTGVCWCTCRSVRLTWVSSSMCSILSPYNWKQDLSLLNSELINSANLDVQLAVTTLYPPPVFLPCSRIYMSAGNSNSLQLCFKHFIHWPISPAKNINILNWNERPVRWFNGQTCLLHILGNLSLLSWTHMKEEERKPI